MKPLVAVLRPMAPCLNDNIRQMRYTLGFWVLVLFLIAGPVHDARAQEKPVVPPSTEEENVKIRRGRDIVQPPSLWYQEGNREPDSLGVLRVPCCNTGDPDAITYPDAQFNFPVNLQVATFVRNGQIAELPISSEVLEGVTEGRIIIRPPAEDHYDIAVPFGVEFIKQVPGEETIIDAKAWYDASLRNPITGEDAPPDRFHTIRELRGQLRSTARGGESVYFFIVASPIARPTITLAPLPQERIVIPEARSTIAFRMETIQRPGLDWITTTALLFGPNRAEIPGNNMDPYVANRIKGDVVSTLRWHASADESYEFTVFGSSQATFSDAGNHHDVPYGLAIAARFGTVRALELRAEASYEDDPFQRQSFQSGDQRLRLMLGYDYRTPDTHRRVSLGPTYYRDQTSLWEDQRSDARELGFTVQGDWNEKLRIGGFVSTLASSVAFNQSWGYIQDAGNSNTTLGGRLALKPNFRFGSAELALGPVAYLQYVYNDYDSIRGFSETNAQVGLELTTWIRF